jgi:XTP/dITP diphosphohydrolase
VKVVLATTNRGKLAELRELLPTGAQLMGLREAGLPAPEESGTTFAANALLKARAALAAGDLALADDSGLEVDALDGAPGVRSARYAGEPGDDARNNTKLLDALKECRDGERTARFRSAVALVTRAGTELVAHGAVEGRIVETPRGALGFGYDPLFEIADPDAGPYNGRTMAELSVAEKNQVSHRGRAYRALLRQIAECADSDVHDTALHGWRSNA